MKYIIIGRDDSNGNEYVRAEAPATAEEAVELCERLNKTGFNEHTSYRIETIEREDSKRFEHLLDRAYPPIRARMNEAMKDALNQAYGKDRKTLDQLFAVKDTDSLHTPRTEDFTLTELFPQGETVAYTLTCNECASEVKNVRSILKKHVTWHNKLLP